MASENMSTDSKQKMKNHKTSLAVLGLVIGLSLLIADRALAHSGRTNAAGCHAGSQPYHCHSGSKKSGVGSGSSSAGRSLISGVVTQVRDGDTFVLNGTPIRLAAVDCPEKNTAKGKLAKTYAERLLGQRVTCELTGATTYDRKVAYCRIGSADIGKVLFLNTSCQVWEKYDVWNRY
ncbi:thermonuclease family protein [Alphaproteobacteria bacterium]|nr:thermonuclease family protein [Alphaproteobacteria bacterium]